MRTTSRVGTGAFILSSLVAVALPAGAATLFVIPPTAESAIGQRVTVDVRVDSAGVSFNAAQATIRFPRDILEVVSLDTSGSAFSFWLEEPHFSNSDGVISFIGGTPYGVSGSAIQVLKILFAARGSGEGPVTITDAAITASDGSGTNILEKTSEGLITVVPGRVLPPPAIPPPQQITRTPSLASGLPDRPALKVPLYPDPAAWYNRTSLFSVNWELPPDISGVSTAVDQRPASSPPPRSEGLFDNRALAALADGTWYLHVRFQNSRGWGPAAHHRIAVDTQPPLGFGISVREGESTDQPAPTLEFKTTDALSGLRGYLVRIGDGDVFEVPADGFGGLLLLPRQAPGTRRVVVRAVDRASNSIESSVVLDIMPIAPPVISFVTPGLFSDGEERLSARGTARPGVSLRLAVHRRGGEPVASAVAEADGEGRWESSFDDPLRNGRYTLSAQAEDERGALSVTVDSPEFRVRSKPIIQLGTLTLGKGGALVFLLVLLAGAFGGGVWFYRVREGRLALRALVMETDMAKVFKLIQEDIERMRQAQATPTPADDAFVLSKLQENVGKMAAYLKKEIQKIRR